MTKGRSRLNFLRRARSTLLSLKTNSSDRIVTDLSMVSPLDDVKECQLWEILTVRNVV